MRIIGGEHGGRRIAAPPGRSTRPMLDRVREALFSRLQFDLPGARVLDLFAGSGSLGLEALSRGAERARMVEQHGQTAELLRRNVADLALEDRAEVARADALDPVAWAWGDGGTRTDMAFVDAPYPLAQGAATRAQLFAALAELVGERLEPHGVAVLHVPRGLLTTASFDARTLGTEVHAESKRYGTNDLWFLSPAEGAE